MKKLTMILMASVLTTGLPACTLMTAGVKKGDERNFARSLNDISAGRAIKSRMSRAEGFRLGGVDVEVAEGIVVLTGNVPSEADRVEAERIAWSGPEIIQVGNEIVIKPGKNIIRSVKDVALQQTIQARYVATKQVKARNFNLEVVDGVVYVLGVARTPEELALAADIAATTKGAKQVVSYVKIAGDKSKQYAAGPGFNGVPSIAQNPEIATTPQYSAPAMPDQQAALPITPSYPSASPVHESGSQSLSGDVDLPAIPDTEMPHNGAEVAGLDDDAIESGEPYYRDPVTGKRITLPPGVKPIPYVPDTGPGSLGAGGAPLPPGAKPSKVLGQGDSYIIDPKTGNMVPVFYKK